MNTKYKFTSTKKSTIKIIIVCLIIILLLKNFINFYNEKTNINTRTKEVKEIYERYDSTRALLLSQLDKICVKENNIFILKEEFTNEQNYDYYNGIILNISHIINSSDKFFLAEQKNIKINYSTLNFNNRIANYKQIMRSIANNNDSNNIVSSYINTIINIISISFKEEYYDMRVNKLFNLFGKEYIYSDYKKTLGIELELMNTLYNIVQYIQADIEI